MVRRRRLRGLALGLQLSLLQLHRIDFSSPIVTCFRAKQHVILVVPQPGFASLNQLLHVEVFLFVLWCDIVPLVMNLVVDHSVTFFEIAFYTCVLLLFILYQHRGQSSNESDFLSCAFNLSKIRILEVSTAQIQLWPPSHLIYYCLYQSLLLENIAGVLKAFKIRSHKI